MRSSKHYPLPNNTPKHSNVYISRNCAYILIYIDILIIFALKNNNSALAVVIVRTPCSQEFLLWLNHGRARYLQPLPQGFSLKTWVGWEKTQASAGHVYSLNILEKLIYMQPAGFALTEVEGSNSAKF